MRDTSSKSDGVRQQLSASLRVPCALAFSRAFRVHGALFGRAVRPVPPDVYRRRIDHVLDMRGVEFLDHFDRGPAILGDLVDVCSFEEPETNVSVTKAVSRSRSAIAINSKLLFIKNCVEQVTRPT